MAAVKLLDISHLDEVLQVLSKYGYSGISYYRFGLSLGLYVHTLHAIEKVHKGNTDRCLLEVLMKWLIQANNVTSRGGPSYYTLIAALRAIGENAVADAIEREKHPACVILARHLSDQSLQDLLPSLVVLLHKEEIIRERLPATGGTKAILSAVQDAVCLNHENLEKFAAILQKFTATVSVGNAILKDYRKEFSDYSLEMIKATDEEKKSVEIHIPNSMTPEFKEMRNKWTTMILKVLSVMTVSPEDLKSYLQVCRPDLRAQLANCRTAQNILELISEECSLTDISLLEGVVDYYKIENARVYIQKYKESVNKFCNYQLVQLEEKLPIPAAVQIKSVDFLFGTVVDVCTQKDTEDLMKFAFEHLNTTVCVRRSVSVDKATEEELSSLEELSQNRLQEITQLELSLKEKDEKITEKQILLAKKEHEIEELKQSITANERELTAHKELLEKRLEEIEQLKRHKEQSRAKSMEIEQLRATLREKERMETESLQKSAQKEDEDTKLATQETITANDRELLLKQSEAVKQEYSQEEKDFQTNCTKQEATIDVELMTFKEYILQEIEGMKQNLEDHNKKIHDLVRETGQQLSFKAKFELESTQSQTYVKIDQESQVDMPVIECVLYESDSQSVSLSCSIENGDLTNKSVQFNYLVPFTDDIPELIKINKRRLYTVNGFDEQTLSWEEHGITIFIPKDALPPSVTSCDIAVVPVVEGNFIFPDDTTPVSAIYAIEVSCKLAKPIKISIQHCVELTDPSHCELMCFAKAEHDGQSPPDEFEILSDGVFTVGSQYGTIEIASFTLFGILRKLSQLLSDHSADCVDRYKLLQFHGYSSPRIQTVHFTMTKNIQSHIQDVINKMKSSQLVKKGELILSFSGPEIELMVKKQSDVNGWDISPGQMPSKIYKDDVDRYSFHNGSLPNVAVKFRMKENAEAILDYDIAITGTTEDSASINVYLEKETDYSERSANKGFSYKQISWVSLFVRILILLAGCFVIVMLFIYFFSSETQLKTNQLEEVRQALQVNSFDTTKWKSVGLSLGLYDNTLRAIERDSSDVEECLHETLSHWLRRADGVSETGGATWPSLVKALRDNNLIAVAQSIENK